MGPSVYQYANGKKSILVLRPLAQGREAEENNLLRASCKMPAGIYFKV